MRCFEVKEVIGVSLCQISAMSNRDRRAGRKRGAHDICCEVRGGFGEDAEDAFTPDTRWVLLSELVQNIGRDGGADRAKQIRQDAQEDSRRSSAEARGRGGGSRVSNAASTGRRGCR